MTEVALLTAERIAARCREDGEFRLCARYWDGSLSIALGESTLAFRLLDGQIDASGGEADVTIAAPAELWRQILAPIPPPFLNDIMPARALGLKLDGNYEMFFQYFPAIRRLVDIMREEANS